MKKLIVLLGVMLVVGCSKEKPIEIEQAGKINVEKIALNDDNLLTVDQYLTDDMSRMTVLIQCDQFFSNDPANTPKHCLNAKEAEDKAVFLDVIGELERDKGRPLTEDEINEISGSIPDN